MKNKIKIYLLFLTVVLMLNILAGCSLTASRSNAKSSLTKQDQIAAISSVSKNENSILQISSGCIGCGHCVRFDPEHFQQEQGSRIPEIISQENLSSNNLQIAIKNCRPGAISLSGNSL